VSCAPVQAAGPPELDELLEAVVGAAELELAVLEADEAAVELDAVSLPSPRPEVDDVHAASRAATATSPAIGTSARPRIIC
jgi:hypothetical protein